MRCFVNRVGSNQYLSPFLNLYWLSRSDLFKVSKLRVVHLDEKPMAVDATVSHPVREVNGRCYLS